MKQLANGVYVTKDDTDEVLRTVRALASQQVLVGIPEDTSERTDADEVTNAMLGYVHETGSPAQNIPARPFLVPGVQKALPEAIEMLRQGATGALDGNFERLDKALHAAGLTASASAKREITSGDFVPLKPATIAARARKRGAKKRRASEEKYLQLVAQGAEPAAAQSAAGIRPLIDTGQLRAALTYVVRKTE